MKKRDMLREEAGERSNWPHKIIHNIIGEKKKKNMRKKRLNKWTQ